MAQGVHETLEFRMEVGKRFVTYHRRIRRVWDIVGRSVANNWGHAFVDKVGENCCTHVLVFEEERRGRHEQIPIADSLESLYERVEAAQGLLSFAVKFGIRRFVLLLRQFIKTNVRAKPVRDE